MEAVLMKISLLDRGDILTKVYQHGIPKYLVN